MAKLAELTLIPLGAESGLQHVALNHDGKPYAAEASGKMVRMQPDGSGQEATADTGGRVPGFDFDTASQLIAVDSVKGCHP